jgi:hypothetical protein
MLRLVRPRGAGCVRWSAIPLSTAMRQLRFVQLSTDIRAPGFLVIPEIVRPHRAAVHLLACW